MTDCCPVQDVSMLKYARLRAEILAAELAWALAKFQAAASKAVLDAMRETVWLLNVRF